MAQHAEQRKLQILDALKREALLKYALVQARRHGAGDPIPGADALLRAIDEELGISRIELRRAEAGSEDEDLCLARIRELEDRRFELLSLMHGNRIQAYNVPLSGHASA